MTTLAERLAPFERRLRRLEARGAAVRGALIGAAVGAGWLGIAWWARIPYAVPTALGVLAAAAGGAFVSRMLRPIPITVVARAADAMAGTQDRFSTALEIQDPEWARLVEREAQALSLERPQDLFHARPNPMFRWTAAAAAALALAFFLPQRAALPTPPEQPKVAGLEAPKELAQAAEELKKAAADSGDAELGKLSKDLEGIDRAWKDGKIDKREALAKVGEIRSKAREAREKAQANREALARVAEGGAGKDMARKIAEGKGESAVRDAASDVGKDAKADAKLAEALDRAARVPGADEELSKSLESAAAAARRGDAETFEKSMDDARKKWNSLAKAGEEAKRAGHGPDEHLTAKLDPPKTDPKDPSDPKTDPKNGTDPKNPGDPKTDPKNGTDPKNPGDPKTDPKNGTDPKNPGDPKTDPKNGTDPKNPGDPKTDPKNGTDPKNPGDAKTDPKNGTDPKNPGDPKTDPKNGTDPKNPGDPKTDPKTGTDPKNPGDPKTDPKNGTDPKNTGDPKSDPKTGTDPKNPGDPKADPKTGTDPKNPGDPKTDPKIGTDPKNPGDPKTDPKTGTDPKNPGDPKTDPKNGTDPKNPGDEKAMRDAVKDAMEKMSPEDLKKLEEAAKSADPKDLEKAAEKAEKGNNEPPSEEMKNLAEKLASKLSPETIAKIAKAIGKDPKMNPSGPPEESADASEWIRSLGTDSEKALSKAEKAASKAEKTLSGKPGDPGDTADASQDGAGASGKPGDGGGSKSSIAGNNGRKPVKFRDERVVVPTRPGEEGDATSETYIAGPEGGGESKVPYEKVLVKYRAEMEKALDDDSYPEEYRRAVRDYFDSLK